MRTKTTLCAVIAATTMTMPVMAGGLVTNTNQNAAYLRQLSQEAIIDITGLYYNPAGTAFLTPGHHFSINVQNAKQDRNITTAYPLMAYNQKYGSATREYDGKANAPVIPSFQYSYNKERWSLNANFALGGGGGKCEFDNGLGTFESLYAASLYSSVITSLTTAITPTLMQAYGLGQEAATQQAQQMAMKAYQGYTLDSYMKGASYQYCFTVGGTYKILDNLAAFVGLRAVYAFNNYTGYVKDIHAFYQNPLTQQTVDQPVESELSLDCDQTGWGFTPILGIDYKINGHWNVAMKYEFKTRLRMENKTTMNEYTAQVAGSNATLGQFNDGAKVAADIPHIFTVGVQYKPFEALRIQAGYDHYDDKDATRYGDTQDLIGHNTWETSAGIEYDLFRWLTLSASWHYTSFGLTDAYMNDLSFDISSHNLGVGARVNINNYCSIDLGFMKTFYKDYSINTENYLAPGLTKQDVYSRTSRVFGIGVNFSF